MPHITWTRVIRTSKRAASLRLRSIGGLWGTLQKYLGLITLAALRSRHRDCSVFGKRLNNNVTVLSFTAADNQDLLFQITVLTCPRAT